MRLNRLVEKVTRAYDEFEFHQVYHGLYDFCVNDLSALYLDMSKDRLYCDDKNSLERRSTQFALNEILMTLIKLMAPILSFTAEDILKYVTSQQSPVASVFMLEMPKERKEFIDEKLEQRWEKLLELRGKVYQKLEALRANKEIGGSLDAEVRIFAKGQEHDELKALGMILPMFFIVSKVILAEGDGDPEVAPASGTKCQRCWMWSESVGEDKTHSTLCARCVKVIKNIKDKEQ